MSIAKLIDQSLEGQWSVLDFMPAAYAFSCPSEVEDAADDHHMFRFLGANVYIDTTDMRFAHKVWHETSPAVGKAKLPQVGDPGHTLARMFDVHIGEGARRCAALRELCWTYWRLTAAGSRLRG
jgi:NADH-dependent peroxiredoxin subunit C